MSCPAREHAPETLEGWRVWDLAQRLGGQVRAVEGTVLGWDMTAALAMGQALGVDPQWAAEILPALEAVMVGKANERMREARDSRRSRLEGGDVLGMGGGSAG